MESATVGSLQVLLPQIPILGTRGNGCLSPLMPQGNFKSTLEHQRFDAIDITIYAYLGIGDVCEHMLGHRQRLRSRLVTPETKILAWTKKNFPKLLSKLLYLSLNHWNRGSSPSPRSSLESRYRNSLSTMSRARPNPLHQLPYRHM